jgi:hypothetical protein
MNDYLLPYGLAYLFEDTLIVVFAVVAMNKMKLRERQGRWLKPPVGLVVFAPGLLLIFVPEILF